MNKIIYIISISFFTYYNYSNAGWFDNKLSTYNCKTKKDATSCSEKCIKGSQSYQLEFLTNKQNGTVMGKQYIHNKLFDTKTFDSCKIFDNNNWDCSERIDRSWNIVKKMNDGIFLEYSEFSNDTNISFFCAK